MTMLTRSALRWMEDHRQRAALRRLLDYDDRTLDDLGYVRAEVEAALEPPAGADALKAAVERSRHSLRLDRKA